MTELMSCGHNIIYYADFLGGCFKCAEQGRGLMRR